jgi:hypothetical protein
VEIGAALVLKVSNPVSTMRDDNLAASRSAGFLPTESLFSLRTRRRPELWSLTRQLTPSSDRLPCPELCSLPLSRTMTLAPGKLRIRKALRRRFGQRNAGKNLRHPRCARLTHPRGIPSSAERHARLCELPTRRHNRSPES